MTQDRGRIAWADLTVEDAEQIRDFYCQVVGWDAGPVEMNGYSDYNMHGPESDIPVAGICHARGANEGLPPQWLIYITVEDLRESISKCEELGGRVLAGPTKTEAEGGFCVIEDPSGAAVALYAL